MKFTASSFSTQFPNNIRLSAVMVIAGKLWKVWRCSRCVHVHLTNFITAVQASTGSIPEPQPESCRQRREKSLGRKIRGLLSACCLQSHAWKTARVWVQQLRISKQRTREGEEEKEGEGEREKHILEPPQEQRPESIDSLDWTFPPCTMAAPLYISHDSLL